MCPNWRFFLSEQGFVESSLLSKYEGLAPNIDRVLPVWNVRNRTHIRPLRWCVGPYLSFSWGVPRVFLNSCSTLFSKGCYRERCSSTNSSTSMGIARKKNRRKHFIWKPRKPNSKILHTRGPFQNVRLCFAMRKLSCRKNTRQRIILSVWGETIILAWVRDWSM